MNLYYEIDDPELIKRFGQKYFVEYDAKVGTVINMATFQPQVYTTKMFPFRHCLTRIWVQLEEEIEYLKFENNDYVPSAQQTNTLPPVDLKEFVSVKLSAKELK